jgi:hypothetical protein
MVKSGALATTGERGHVAYNRRNPITGAMIHVGQKFSPGQDVFYKVAGSPKARRGTIVHDSHMAEHFVVQGKMLRGTRQRPQHHIHEDMIWTPEEHSENQAYKYATNPNMETTSTKGRRLTATVSNERAESIPVRMGMTEGAILMHPKIQNMKRAVVANYAGTNSIDRESDDWDNLDAEATIGIMNSLRREAATATEEDISAFKEDLDHYDAWLKDPEAVSIKGRPNSRIFVAMNREAKTVALADVKRLTDIRKELRDPLLHDDDDGDTDPLDNIADENTPQSLYEKAQEEKLIAERINAAIDDLDPVNQDIIYRRFGLAPHEEHTYRELADAMNEMGVPYVTAKNYDYEWNDRLAHRRVMNLLEELGQNKGVAQLHDLLRSIQELRTLQKARKNRPQVKTIDGRRVFLCTEEFRKSRQGERLDDLHPEGQWVAVTNGGPLQGKHLFFLIP